MPIACHGALYNLIYFHMVDLLQPNKNIARRLVEVITEKDTAEWMRQMCDPGLDFGLDLLVLFILFPYVPYEMLSLFHSFSHEHIWTFGIIMYIWTI